MGATLFSHETTMPLFKTTSRSPAVNILELKPLRKFETEPSAGERVNILVPRFGTGKVVKLLVPRLVKSVFRVKLDDFGSFVWQHCDGETAVAEICEKMRSKFGEPSEPVEERVGRFVDNLIRHDYVSVAMQGERARYHLPS